jgi:hypothetical protein
MDASIWSNELIEVSPVEVVAVQCGMNLLKSSLVKFSSHYEMAYSLFDSRKSLSKGFLNETVILKIKKITKSFRVITM